MENKRPHKSKMKSAMSWMKTPSHLSYGPWVAFVRFYNLRRLGRDLNAGLNTALLAFPQGIAYAVIAGLPVSWGIYGSIIASFIGALLSRSPYTGLGPTNSTSVLLMSTFAILGLPPEERITVLPLLLLLVAFILMMGAYFKMGTLTQYISRSVMTGYVAASVALIFLNQFWHVLGLHTSESMTTAYEIIQQIYHHIQYTQWTTLLLAALTMGIYLVLNRWFKRLPNIALTLVFSTLLGCLFHYWGWSIEFIAAIDLSDWSLSLPQVSLASLSQLASSALAISLLCLLESASIGKSISAKSGKLFDINQEMFALGVANLGCSLFSGLPASTSGTRSNLSFNTKAYSSLNHIFSALFCVLITGLLGSWLRHVPVVTLAVLILIVGVTMINRHMLYVVWRSTRADAVVFAATFGSGLLFTLDMAVYFGVVTSIAFFLRTVATPEMVEYTFDELGQLTQLNGEKKRSDVGISIVHVEGTLFFGSCDVFHEQIRRVCEDKTLKAVILKMRNAYHLDATSVLALEELVLYMKDNQRILLLCEARRDLIKILKRSGLMDVIGKDYIFADNPYNPNLSVARALRKAQDITGQAPSRISIYAEAKEMDGLAQSPAVPSVFETRA